MAPSCVGSRKEENLALLFQRYPDIAFLHSCTSFDPKETTAQEEMEQEAKAWSSMLDLSQIEILYVYGIGQGHYYTAMKSWLEEKKERALIFFEDDLAALDAFLGAEAAQSLLENAQVSLYYVAHPKQWKEILNECSRIFPCDRLEVSAIASYRALRKRKIAHIRLELLRRASFVQSLLSEGLYYHVLMQNLLPNLQRIPESFYVNQLKGKFKNVPAVICGAGPSLSQAIPFLKELGNKALIIAGGSTITAMSNQGVRPHIAMALDPNYEEVLRLKPSVAFEVPFFYASRLHPDVFHGMNAPWGYMSSDTGGVLETWMEKKLGLEDLPIGPDLGHEAFSVTTLAVAMAQAMGCNPILFCGVDLAYIGMKRYAEGVMPSSEVFLDEMKKQKKAMERLLKRKDRNGKSIYSLVKWVMEASCLGEYAKKHPETSFFHCTEGGLPIPHVPFCPLPEVIEKHCTASYDLRGMLHAEAQQLNLSQRASSSQVATLFSSLAESLERCLDHIEGILEEVRKVEKNIENHQVPLQSGKKSVLEMDLEEEEAYAALLQIIPAALDQMFSRYYFTLSAPDTVEYRKVYIEKELHKWKQMELVVKQSCRNICSKHEL